MPNFIRVNLVIFEDDAPWLYQTLAAINPKRRARYMRERLLLAHSMGTQLTAARILTPPVAATDDRAPVAPAIGYMGGKPVVDVKMDRASSSVLEMLDATEESCGLDQTTDGTGLVEDRPAMQQ
ncbi:MAG: hypothetical protein ACYC9J_06460 [Sulfuricaulis sp.]